MESCRRKSLHINLLTPPNSPPPMLLDTCAGSSHLGTQDIPGCCLLETFAGIMPETMEISDAAKSGDGTTTNVGIKMTGTFQCPECRQKFDSEKAKQLHWKFIHDPNRHQED